MARALVYERSLETICVKIKVDPDSDPSDNEMTEREEQIKSDDYDINNVTTSISSETNDDHEYRKQQKNIAEAAEKNQYFCTVCLIALQSRRSLQMHKTIWKSKFICDRCDTRFCAISAFTKHVKYSCTSQMQSCFKKQKLYCCNHCNVKTRNKHSIQSHLYHVHGDLLRSDKITREETSRTSKCSTNSENTSFNRKLKPSCNTSEQLSTNAVQSPTKKLKSISFTKNSLETSLKILDRSPKTSRKSLDSSIKTSLKSLDDSPETSQKSLDRSRKSSLKSLDTPLKTSPKSLNNSPKTSPTILNGPHKRSLKRLSPLHGPLCKIRNNNVEPKKMKQSSLYNFIKVSEVKKSVVPSVAVSMNDIEKSPTLTNVNLENETCEVPRNALQDTSLVQTHVKPKTICLTKETQTEFTNPVDSASSINNKNSVDPHNQVSYNLRPSRLSSYSTLFMYESMIFKNVLKRTIQKSCGTSRKGGSFQRQASETLSSSSKGELFKEKQYKECVVRLERIDLKGNNIKLTEDDTPKINSRKHITSSVFSESFITKCLETYKCPYCNKLFPSKKEQHRHREKFHSIYMSSICSARYMSISLLVNHYVRQHISFPYKECCVCFKQFDSPMILRRHMVIHYLKITTSKQEAMAVNIKRNCNAFKKRHKCEGCFKQFWLRSCLEQHQNVCRQRNALLKKKHLDSVKIDILSTTGSSENTEELQKFDTNRSRSPDPNGSDTSPRNKICSTSDAGVTEEQHSKKDHPRQMYLCFVCGRKFKTYQHLCLHKNLYFRPANKKCDICNIGFPSTKLLQQHMLATHKPPDNARYVCFCKFCNQGFHNMESFWVHAHHVHLTNIKFARGCSKHTPSCNVCNLLFESYSQFIDHKMYYYKEQAFECVLCNKSFQGMYQLRHHNQLEHYPVILGDLYIHKCNICKESFKYESHLYAHKLHVHSDVTVGMQYSIETDITIASEDITSVLVKTYKCYVCDLHFVNSRDLTMHQMEYSDDGEFVCDKCTRRYHTSSLLAKHYSLNHIGSDQNLVKCNHCDEMLLTDTSMQCHEKHFHGKNSDLQIVNSTLNMEESSSSLIECHLKDANVCMTCDAEFNDMLSLKNHLLEYSDIGSYTCTHCQRKFTKLCSLEEHIMKHLALSNALTIDHCPICNIGFMNPQDIRGHVLHLHRYETFGLKQNAPSVPDSSKAGRPQEDAASSHSVVSSDDENDLKCPECNVEFSIKHAMRSRSRFKNNGCLKCPSCDYIVSWFPFRQCNYCMVRCDSSAALYRHVIERHNDDNDPGKEHPDSMTFYYLCKVCDIRYATAKEFLAHDIKMHRKGRRHQWPSAVSALLALQINMDLCCEKCGKIFQNKKCFKNHFKAFHAAQEKS